ncbi:MAG: MotA/TolQ/ExbB proton channel family protein [Deltaproteobacteria bacterium]|nr:MotA/TolQ/ExbB proton channel family protein [Deltaproteobacteria bacterium]
MFEQLCKYLEMGGIVTPALMIIGVSLWTLIGLRLQLLRRGFSGDPTAKTSQMFERSQQAYRSIGLLDEFICKGISEVRTYGAQSRERLDLLVMQIEQDVYRYRKPIRSMCGAAPLLGLLGTVSGMIETFHSLTAMELFALSGGVADGVAEALISTQIGLLVAIPGVIVGRLLDRKGEALRNEAYRLREHLTHFVASATREAT